MADTEAVLRIRLTWVKHFGRTGDAGLTCRRCGMPRLTLRSWWCRYQEASEDVRNRFDPRREMWQNNWKYILAFVKGQGVVLTKVSR